MTKNRQPTASAGTVLERYRESISRCVKCGSCRAACPPFLSAREESFSARGRMALIKAFLDGRLPATRIFEDRLETCTSCLACEAGCASSVPVTEIIQAAKEQLARETGFRPVKTIARITLANPGLMHASAWLAPFALQYGAGLSKSKFRPAKPNIGKSGQGQGSKKVVLFFPGCAVNYLQPDIGAAAIEVLNRIGFETVIPEDTQCCGRPLLSLGDRNAAEETAARNAELFLRLNPAAVVTVCASCGLTFKKEYPKLLRPGTRLPVLLDIHEILDSELSGIGPLKRTITWHDPCHLGRGQGLANTARAVLQRTGARFFEMRDADSCCGFGGVMRLTHPKLSNAIAGEKVKRILETRGATVVTGCPACRMQIMHGLRRAGSDRKVIHTVQLVREALAYADSAGSARKPPLRAGA